MRRLFCIAGLLYGASVGVLGALYAFFGVTVWVPIEPGDVLRTVLLLLLMVAAVPATFAAITYWER